VNTKIVFAKEDVLTLMGAQKAWSSFENRERVFGIDLAGVVEPRVRYGSRLRTG
jgi:hypothetical protein